MRFRAKQAKYMAWTLGALAACLAALPMALAAAPSEIRVDISLDGSDFVSGERIRGVVDVAHSSPDKVSVGYSNS